MKKLLISLSVLFAVLLASVYLFIPSRLRIQEVITIKAPLPGVTRFLMQDSNWHKWWPGVTPFVLNEKIYSLRRKIFSAIDIDIRAGKDSLPGRMNMVIIEADSTSIGWDAELISSNNPFKRFSQKRQVKAIRKDMNTILTLMKAFLEHPENIYGIHITETTVTDSVLITTRRSFPHKPGVQDIDVMIQELKKYIAQNNSVEKNYPMLNVVKISESEYETQVAIPVDRKLPETENFIPKFLLKGGKILETEVKGGLYTVESAFKEFENYRADYKYNSPAIPFQLLVTDRTKEPDSTKWITKLYYPVL